MPKHPRAHLGSLLLAAQFDLAAQANARSARYGLKPLSPERAQFLGLVDAGVVRLPALGRALNLPRQTVGSMVDALEELGFVERQPVPDDNVIKQVRLGPVGKVWAKQLRRAAEEVEAHWNRRLGSPKMKAVRSLLEEVRESLASTPRGNGQRGSRLTAKLRAKPGPARPRLRRRA